MMLRVIGSKRSRTLRVLWLLEELQLEYRHDPAMPHSEEVLARNPSGKIPVLVDGDTILTDSTAIMTYLADRHGRLTFPAGTAARARQDGYTGLLLDEFDACLWSAAKHGFVLPVEHRCPEIKPVLRWEFGQAAARLAASMQEDRFLVGDEPTIPDIILAHCLLWARLARMEHGQPALDTFLKQMCKRPSFSAISGDSQ